MCDPHSCLISIDLQQTISVVCMHLWLHSSLISIDLWRRGFDSDVLMCDLHSRLISIDLQHTNSVIYVHLWLLSSLISIDFDCRKSHLDMFLVMLELSYHDLCWKRQKHKKSIGFISKSKKRYDNGKSRASRFGDEGLGLWFIYNDNKAALSGSEPNVSELKLTLPFL